MLTTESRSRRSLVDWLETLERSHSRPIDLGLERVSRVWRALGAPRPAPVVVTVAGTNGKGSTVHALEALAQAHGLRTGVTVSPHLVRFNERIRIDGVEASDAALVAVFEEIDTARRALTPDPVTLTYFETTILAALRLIARAEPDLAILEVGLGGRLDAVNMVDCDLAVITPVALDHQAWLGKDRETIGAEKAGILRPARPVVITDPQPTASLLERATEMGAPVLRLNRDFKLEGGVYHGRATALTPSPLRLPGLAASAVHPSAIAAALTVLRLLGVSPDPERVQATLVSLVVPGRRQHLRWRGVECILDVAHNPHATSELVRHLAQDCRCELLFGAFADKDVEGMLVPLAPYLAGVTLVSTPGERGLAADALAARLAVLELPAVATAASVAAGLERAVTRARGKVLVVCGSCTVVGAVLAILAAELP